MAVWPEICTKLNFNVFITHVCHPFRLLSRVVVGVYSLIVCWTAVLTGAHQPFTESNRRDGN